MNRKVNSVGGVIIARKQLEMKAKERLEKLWSTYGRQLEISMIFSFSLPFHPCSVIAGHMQFMRLEMLYVVKVLWFSILA